VRWFKHMSDLARDEDISRYLDAAGKDRVTAYGFLMYVLEAVASRMEVIEGDLVCSATYSIPHWGRITYSHANRVRKYLSLCEVIEWVQVEFEEGSCRVIIPKMLQWRDEYTRKSGHTPDNVAQKREEEIRLDKRESRQEGSLPDCLKAEGASRSPPADFKPSKVLQAWAMKNHPSVPVDKETATFMLYEFPNACSNWDDKWKRWIIGADEYQAKQIGLSGQPNPNEQLLELAKLMGIEKQEDETEPDFRDRVNKANDKRINRDL